MFKVSDDIRYKVVEIGTALAISAILYLLSYTSPYQRLEFLSLDARFNLRPPIETHPKIATIDIDDTALREEGRWQDWTRDKHARITDIVRHGNGAQLGIDILFPEESEKVVGIDDISYARSIEEVLAAFRDYDQELARAAEKGKNVYLIATFAQDVRVDSSEFPDLRYSESSVAGREHLERFREKSGALRVKRETVEPILSAPSPTEIPIPRLVENARGVGFAQIVKEADGVVRKYPTFIRCDYPPDEDADYTHLYPSLGLRMACDYLHVPLESLKVRPGEYIEVPGACMSDGSKRDLYIPINARGEMVINWAGDYKETFRHFPYSSLIRLDEERILQEVKQFLSAQDPSIFTRLSDLVVAVYDEFSDAPNLPTYVAFALCIYGADWYELMIEQEGIEKLEASHFSKLFGISPEEDPALYDDQRLVFENTRLNMSVLRLLSERPTYTLSEVSALLEASPEAVGESYAVVAPLSQRGGPSKMDRPLFFLPPALVNENPLSSEDLRDGIFFYGLTATGTHDLSPMPYSSRYPMVGALANVFNTIVTDQFIAQLAVHWRLPLFLIIGFCAGFILSSSTAIRGSVFTVLFLTAYLLLAYELFATRGVWIEVVGPIGIVVLSDAAIVWYKFSTAEKKRKFIKNAFSHYMNPAVVEEIAKNPDMLELGGKKMELTAFFSDVASFTSISEKLTEHEIVELLNEYLTEMTEILLKHYGNLDKYEGDLIMAFFGAPIHFPDHATRACYTALEMQEKLVHLREKWRSENRPELRARIGINTGPMIVGNMGSKNRFDYTVMGDAVNLASRLEGVNKQYSTKIMISEFTLEHCKSDIISREIDLIRVKGKEIPVRIHEVLARAGDGISDEHRSVLEHYSRGLEAYRLRNWEQGIAEFQLALDIKPDDGPSLTYLKRCREYLESPPPDDWDGVYVMTTK